MWESGKDGEDILKSYTAVYGFVEIVLISNKTKCNAREPLMMPQKKIMLI